MNARFGSRHGCVLGFRGLQIDVHSNEAAPLQWLVEFLSPHLAAESASVRRRDVSLILDPSHYARLLAKPASGHQERIDCFTADGEFEQLALWHEDADGRLLHDAGAQAFVRIAARQGGIEIVAPTDHARVRISLMRVIRELAMLQSLHRGDLFIHAAAGVLRGRAVVIAGQKRAGKTTMLLDLLRRGEVQYLSNDRIMVDTSADPPVVRGMPTIVKVRAESLRFVPSLTEPAPGDPQRHYLTMQECASGSPLLEPPTRQPTSMSPVQFCRWLGVEPRAAAPIGTIVFPTVDPAVTRFDVRVLRAPQAAERIRASLFSAGSNGRVSQAFGADWDGAFPAHDATLDACRRLAERCAAYECRIGPDAFHRPSVWESIA
ncbi:MAG: hypothetical protein HY271_05560 [Deltaproteobacteria bacterium]|nr:hypothetical protein [Deltaproteobacteria bacterium]